MIIEIESVEEAKAILHCLQRTSARNTYGDLKNILDHCENFEKKLVVLINKPVETTNERPNHLFCTCNNRKWNGEHIVPKCDNCGGEFD